MKTTALAQHCVSGEVSLQEKHWLEILDQDSELVLENVKEKTMGPL